MTLKETTFKQGGLMRCCIESLGKYVLDEHPDDEAVDGLTHSCRYHEGKDEPDMVLEGGVWRWNREHFGRADPD